MIDEAHCISIWGHNFRPAYRRIINLVNLLPLDTPVLATTATATKEVESDIHTQISGKLQIIRGELSRSNFNLRVVNVSNLAEKLIWLGQNIATFPGTGLIYTGTRNEAEQVSKWLNHIGISCKHYHSKVKSEERKEVEKGLLEDTWKCIAATNALGMGIDKPDIRFIVHTQFPQSPIHYYQEIGRAGRDNKPAEIVLLYNYDDKQLPEHFIENAKPCEHKYIKIINALKLEMLSLSELTRRVNLYSKEVKSILNDLLDQNIIRKINLLDGNKYEYVRNAPPFDPKLNHILKQRKYNELDDMIDYATTKKGRMKYLCSYLDDKTDILSKNCDNTTLTKLKFNSNEEWNTKLNTFIENDFPSISIVTSGSNRVNGFAASYYGDTKVGNILHRCKYVTKKDFPPYLLNLTLKAFYKEYSSYKFDLILFIPPTVSGTLVQNFSKRVSERLKIPVSDALKKVRATKEQKVFENNLLKSDNVKDVFIVDTPSIVTNKAILLIDDIYDSGATLKEAGKYLTKCGAKLVAPLVIAKTVGGTQD